MAEQQKPTFTVLEKLATVPTRIAHATRGKSLEQLSYHSVPAGWSVREVLAHIRAVDAIVATRIYMILAREQPFLVDFDERRWADIAHYTELDFQRSLTFFSIRQEELVTTLQQLPTTAWYRTGLHEFRGTLSLFDIVQDLANHEEEHSIQIEELLTLV